MIRDTKDPPRQETVWDCLQEPEDDLSRWFTFTTDGSIVCHTDPPIVYPIGKALYEEAPIVGWQLRRGPEPDAELTIIRPNGDLQYLRYNTKCKCWEIERDAEEDHSQVPPKCRIRTAMPLAHRQVAPHTIDSSHPIELHLDGMIRIGKDSYGQFSPISDDENNIIIKKGRGIRRMLVIWYPILRETESGLTEELLPRVFSYERRRWHEWTERSPNIFNRFKSIYQHYQRKGGVVTDIIFFPFDFLWRAFDYLVRFIFE